MQAKSKDRVFPDFSGKIVLVTGGTRGIGLEIALAFAKRGARCVLTYRWGDHDDKAINQVFEKEKAIKPILFQADVAGKEDTDKLFQYLKTEIKKVDIFISNVSVAMIIRSFEAYSFKALKQSISYSSWPMVAYTLKMYETFGSYPKYVIGMSSTGPDHYSFGYDFVAASKTVIEVLCRYLNYRLRDQGVIINAIRSRAVKTTSFHNTFGKELQEFVNDMDIPENYWITPEEIAQTTVALCSGYCDAISGQTITVDRGTSFFDNFMDIYTRYRNNRKINTQPHGSKR